MCVCSRAALQDTYLLNKGMKGKLVEEDEGEEIKVGRSVSFDLGAGGEDGDNISEALEDPWKDLRPGHMTASEGSTTILVDQPVVEATIQEDFDIPFKEDVLKMKEMGLPLGFNNVSPYEVEEGGAVVETQMKDRLTKGKRRGKKKKRQQVVDEATKQRFDQEWWVIHGNDKVMQVWKERYGKYMDDQEEEAQDDEEEEESQTWQEYDDHGNNHGPVVESKESNLEQESCDPSQGQHGGWGTTNPAKAENTEGGQLGWGQVPPPSTTASGWGEVTSAPTVASNSKSLDGNGVGRGGGWGEGTAHQGGAVWGDTWGGGEPAGGGQADWDALWIEVTNEVYKAEMVKWMEDGEIRYNHISSEEKLREVEEDKSNDGVNDIENNLSQVNLRKASEDPTNTREVKETVDNKNEERQFSKGNWNEEGEVKAPKVNAGLAGILRHLQSSGDGSFTVAEGDMNKEGEDDEGPEELKVEREAPGLDQALRAFGQLGYVFEPEAGARWEGTPGLRWGLICQNLFALNRIFQERRFELEI